jgi:hypothetical protein
MQQNAFSLGKDVIRPRAMEDAWSAVSALLVSYANTHALSGRAAQNIDSDLVGGVGGANGVEADILPLLAVLPMAQVLAQPPQTSASTPALSAVASTSAAASSPRRQTEERKGKPPLLLRVHTGVGVGVGATQEPSEARLVLLRGLLRKLTHLHAMSLHLHAETNTGELLSPLGVRSVGQMPFSPMSGAMSASAAAAGLAPSAQATTPTASLSVVGADNNMVDVTGECRAVASSNSRYASRVLDHARLLREWVSNVSHYEAAAPRCHIGKSLTPRCGDCVA